MNWQTKLATSYSVVCRLGWYGKNFHDSNYMIFDTIKGFRTRTRQDDAKSFQ